MKLHLPTRPLTVLATGLALTMSVVAFRAQADQWDKKTILTIDQPIQVSKTYLEPGTYVFKLLDSQSDRHIVQIFNKDQTHIIDTVLAIPNYRLRPTGKSRFAFWETPAGNAKALRAWFYPGDNFGQEFAYPKNPRQLDVAMMSKSRSDVITKEETLSETSQQEAKVTASPEPEYQQPEVAQNEVAQATPEVAQATPKATTSPETESYPAPSTATPSDQSAQSTPSTDRNSNLSNNSDMSNNNNMSNRIAQRTTREELPKTASPYTSIGLFGVFMLGFYGLMRVKQTS